jgi:hypothetical protein
LSIAVAVIVALTAERALEQLGMPWIWGPLVGLPALVVLYGAAIYVLVPDLARETIELLSRRGQPVATGGGSGI